MTQRTPVLHVLTDLEAGGAQIAVTDLCVRLGQRGWNIHVAYSSLRGEVPNLGNVLRQRLVSQGVQLHDLSPMPRKVSPVFDIVGLWKLVALMVRLRPKIVHTHMSKAGVLGRLAAALAGIPHIVHSVHGWSFYSARGPTVEKGYVMLERLAASVTQHMLAVSQATIRDGLSRGIGRPDIYSVVRSAIDVEAFRSYAAPRDQTLAELQLPHNAQIVGTVGRLASSKAPLDFLAMAQEVLKSFPECKFLIIGTGPLDDDVRKAITDRGLSNCVFQLGFRDDLRALVKAMDVFVLTSHWEGLSRTLIEALAAGVPAVVTDVGGHSEVVTPGVNGYLVEPGDIATLAKAVGRLLAAPLTMSNSYTGFLDDFDLRVVVDQHVQLYRSLLAAT